MKSYGQVIGAVTEFVVTVLLCLFIGRQLDGKLQTGNRFLAIGTILGFLSGVIRLAINLKKSWIKARMRHCYRRP